MKYGYFDDQQKEYVITRPDTPLPWINYLGTTDFYGIISNTAGGYCFYQDSRMRRLTRYRYNNIPMDSNGRYLYIKDGDSTWSPMWKPMRSSLDKYECRHGLGYSKISGIKNELEVSTLFFIPVEARNEIWHVKLTNHSGQTKKIRLWGFIEWCLWEANDDMTNFQRNYSTGQVEVEDKVIFHKTEYRERRNHYGYFSVNKETSGFDSSRDAFVGVHNGLEAPQAILDGKCKNSIAYGWLPIGVHQIDIELKAGETTTINFLLGYAENPVDNKFNDDGTIRKDEFREVYTKYSDDKAVENAFEEQKKYWDNLLSAYKTETPDVIVNRMVNIWNQYQCMVTFNMSRSTSLYESGIGRGMGYRDSNQDILGFVQMLPERARQRIIDIASTQLSDGTCYHQYQPLTKKGNADIGGGFNDDPLWLILSVSAYIRETGDSSILNEKAGFADEPRLSAGLSPTPSPKEGTLKALSLGEGLGEAGDLDAYAYQTADRTVYPLLKEFARTHRKNPTQAESVIWEKLRHRGLKNYKFRRQHIIGLYIADFICLPLNLIIEIDGLIHQLPGNKELDEVRTQWLERQGYRVIRFNNGEVINEVDLVLNKILDALKNQESNLSAGLSPTPSPEEGALKTLSFGESSENAIKALSLGEGLGEAATLMDHLNISLAYTLNNRGPHGLPLIGHADWNDCLNLNCFSTTPGESFQLAGHIENDRIAESVMIAGLFCKASDEMAEILNYINKPEEAKEYNKNAENMRKTIYEHGWDGEWFLRAYDSYSKKLGSKENDEGKIFIESQGWGVLGGAGLDNGYALKALDSVKKHLSTSNGIVLQQPAFQKYYVHLGEVSSYPPGYKENAGIFTHNNTWIQIAETILGRGDQAMEYYKSICPPTKEEQIDIYRSEPYVYSQMTAGRDAPTPGEGKNSWLTGTVAWSLVAITQYILGVRPGFDGLIIDPCIPSDWKQYNVVRKFRNSTYNITVKNPDGVCKGVKNIKIDGKFLQGNKIPVFNDGEEHSVEVELG